MKFRKHPFSLFCKTEAHIFLIRGGYILCACKSVAGLINTPPDSQCNILQALCIWSQCMLSQQPPFHFCQDSLPHLGLLSCSLESLLNSPSSSNLPLSEWTVLYSFASLLCLWKHTGQCRKLGTKNIHALPLFSAVCLDQMDGPGD